MKHVIDVVSEKGTGRPLAGVTVNIYLAGTTTPATLYSDDGITTTSNPLTTNSKGVLDFYVADGLYDVNITGATITTITYPNVEFADVLQASSTVDTDWLAASLNSIKYANVFSGASADSKIQAAAAAGSGTVIAPPSLGQWNLLTTAVPNNTLLVDYRPRTDSNLLVCGRFELNTTSTSLDIVNPIRFEVGLNPSANTSANSFGITTEGFTLASCTKNFTAPGQLTGTYGSFSHLGSGTYNTLVGGAFEGFNSGAGTGTLIRGVYGTANNGGVHAGNPDQSATNTGTASNLRAVGGACKNITANTVDNAAAFYAEAPTNNGGGTITNYYGQYFASINPATIPNITNKYSIFANATAGSVFIGDTMGVGTAPITGSGVICRHSGLVGANQFGFQSAPVAQSDCTSVGAGVIARCDTAAASFTQGINACFYAQAGSTVKGAGSTITKAYGLYVDDVTVGGTANRAIRTGLGAVELGDAIVWSTTNTSDIGVSTVANAPRTVYAGTSVVTPLVNATTGFQVAGAAAAHTFLKGNGTNFVGGTVDVSSADITGVMGAGNGGTGNGFFTVAGPATSAKTFTFQNASSNVASLVGASVANTIPKWTDTTGTVWGASALVDNGTTISSSESINLASGTALSWNSDVGLSRSSAGVLYVGNGTAGDVSGVIRATTFQGASASPATTGVVRVASGDTLAAFRNNANSANIGITKNTSDQLVLTAFADTLLPAAQVGSSAQFVVNTSGLPTKSNNVTLTGMGFSSIVGSTSQKSESAADTNVLTVTTPAAGMYKLCFTMDVSAASAATLGWTATWTDSNGHAQAPTNLAIYTVGTSTVGTTVSAAANGVYNGEEILSLNGGANVVVKLTFSGTSFAAKVSASLERMV